MTTERKIGSRYYQYQELIDRTIQGLCDLFSCSVRSISVLVADGEIKQTEFDTLWISEDAKKSYEMMQEHLKILLELQRQTIKNTETEKLTDKDILSAEEANRMIQSYTISQIREYMSNELNQVVKKENPHE